MIEAYAYCRVSGRGQLDGDGPERQETAIQEHCACNGIVVRETFIEPITGKSDLEGRKEFQRMRAMLLAGPIKTVIIEKLDRLARDLMIQEQFVADLQRNGVTLLSTFEPDLCSKDPTRVLMRQIMGAFAQFERAMIVSRTRVARERIRSRGGRCEGQAPYGYQVVGQKGQKQLEPIESEQKVIRDVHTMRLQGRSILSIAKILNLANIPSRHGKPWGCMQILRILKRPQMSQNQNPGR